MSLAKNHVMIPHAAYDLLCSYAFYCEDLKKEFVTDFVFKMLKTSALYEGICFRLTVLPFTATDSCFVRCRSVPHGDLHCPPVHREASGGNLLGRGCQVCVSRQHWERE